MPTEPAYWPVDTPVDVMLDRVRSRADQLGRRRRLAALGGVAVPVVLVALLATGVGRGGFGPSRVRTVPPIGGAPDIAVRHRARSAAPSTTPASAVGLQAGSAAAVAPGADAAVSSTTLPAAGSMLPDVARGRVGFMRANNLWMVNADGTGERQLTHGDYQLDSPTWSPDGTRLAGIDVTQRVEVVNLDGTVHYVTDLAHQAYSVRWSPDGSKLAVQLTDRIGSAGGVTIIDLATRAQRVLDYGLSPDWSPDGTRLVYSCQAAICVIGADGTHKQQLPFSSSYMGPRWSPDGRHLLLTWQPGSSDNQFLVEATLDGASRNVLMRSPGTGYAYSPDGQWVAVQDAYATEGGKCFSLTNSCGSTATSIFLVRHDGVGLHQLTFGTNDSSPSFVRQ